MKVVKYIFLLFLLLVIAACVYVATQKSDFYVRKSSVINVPKSIVFNYMNDYKNWEDWGSWKEDDAGMKFNYPDNTTGEGGYFTWIGKNGDGKMITTFVKQDDSIAQKVNYSGNEYKSYLSFRDTIGGTKVTWTAKGSVDYITKIYATFSGGINNLMGIMFERSLNNLNTIVVKEINSFDIKVNGIFEKVGGFYIKQTIECKTSEMQNKLHLNLPKIINFFKKNNLVMNGYPFVINESRSNDTVKFAVCGPLREEIFISPGSDISVSFLPAFSALKTTLKGDYSHLNVAKKEAIDGFVKMGLLPNAEVKNIDVYVKNVSDIKNPSEWITEIFIPIKSKEIIVPVVQKEIIKKPISPIKTTIDSI